MRFELDVEVQPDFDLLPSYKSLTRARRPVKEIKDADVDAQQRTFLERYAQMVPKLEGGAEIGDFVIADLTFHRGRRHAEPGQGNYQFRLQPELRFQDGHVPQLAEALSRRHRGARIARAEAQIGSASPDPALRGQAIRVTFHVKDLKQLRLPVVDEAFLRGIGFDTQRRPPQRRA